MLERQKRRLIFDYLKTLNVDIYCLQEARNDWVENENMWAWEWGGPCLWNTGN